MIAIRVFLKKHSLIGGVLLMFLLTWPIELSSAGIIPFQVPFAVYVLLGYGFVLASVIMTAITLGKREVVLLLRRFLIYRVAWKWYLVAFLLLPSLQVAAVVLTAGLGGTPVDFGQAMAYEILDPTANLLALAGPWFLYELFTNGEEIGWRGYLLPRLQARYGALIASLLVGLIWGLWHIPKFVGTNSGREQSFGWFMVAHLSLAVLYTWLYNSTHGSLLLVTIFHAAGNTAAMFLPVSFASPGGVPGNLAILLYVMAAAVVVLFAGLEKPSHASSQQELRSFRTGEKARREGRP